MKKLILLICLSLGIFLSFSQTKKTYYPQVFFDKKLAQEMIGYGNSSIEGRASTKQKNAYGIKPLLGEKHYARKGTVIMLFPVTPYLEEFIKLRREYENSNTAVYMSEEAFKYRIEAYADEYGRFKFERLKPGKYYIETILNFTATGNYREQTGTETGYNAFGGVVYSTPIYQTFFYNYESSNREKKFVEIKKDGQVIEINL